MKQAVCHGTGWKCGKARVRSLASDPSLDTPPLGPWTASCPLWSRPAAEEHILWLWTLLGRCCCAHRRTQIPVLDYLLLWHRNFGRHIPGAHSGSIPIFNAWVLQPDCSLSCQPPPAFWIRTNHIPCWVSWVQDHRPDSCEPTQQVV